MTGNVVNLRMARKRKARETRESEAEANRRKFGRSKQEKRSEEDEVDRHARVVDNARRGVPNADT